MQQNCWHLPKTMCALAARAPYARSYASLSVHGKYHVEITQTAEGDVDEIWTHISADSVENATRFVNQLEEKIGTLERMPQRCPAIPENKLLGTQYRHLILGDYRVIFRVEASTVFVLRIVQGNRLLDTSFFGEGGTSMPRKSR